MTARAFRSFAKINLGLEVLGKRPDGYHELRTLFASVSLHDILEFSPRRSGIELECDDPSLPADHRNLAYRAAVALQRLSGARKGVRIHLRKRIPIGGGLGGGSSNAATVLRALNRIWRLKMTETDLVGVAKELGADVPYFLFGGPALGLGRGDDITPVDLEPDKRVLLVKGGAPVSTAAVFGNLAAGPKSAATSSPIDRLLLLEHPAKIGTALAKLRNDLSTPAERVSPELARAARAVRRAGKASKATLAAMSGSGSTFFLLFDLVVARDIAKRHLERAGFSSKAAALLSRRDYLDRFEIARS